MPVHYAPPVGAELESELSGIRRRLMVDIAPEPRRRPRKVVLSFGLVTAVTAALVAGNLTGVIGFDRGASAQAAEVLQSAATASIAVTDPILQPGQYLKVETTAVTAGFMADEEGARTGKQQAVMAPTTSTLYIPYDRDSAWIWVREYQKPTTWYGANGDAIASQYWEERVTQGTITRQEAIGGEFDGFNWASENADVMPRDPQKLLAWFHSTYEGGSANIDEDTFVRAADFLSSGIVPADLRAALYNMIALIPGVDISDNTATLDGATGVALSRSEDQRDGQRQEIIIDPSTGALIGERTILTQNQGAIPAGAANESTSVTTSVVSSAP